MTDSISKRKTCGGRRERGGRERGIYRGSDRGRARGRREGRYKERKREIERWKEGEPERCSFTHTINYLPIERR